MTFRSAKIDRNREIMALFEGGEPIEGLMTRYNLTNSRIRAILADERNRRAASLDGYYRKYRQGI